MAFQILHRYFSGDVGRESNLLEKRIREEASEDAGRRGRSVHSTIQFGPEQRKLTLLIAAVH